MAKDTDGDFSKFVNDMKKPRDDAQRWRAYKNFSRFFKNPFGYVYWKMEPFHRQNRFRFAWAIVVFNLWSSFLLYVSIKGVKDSMVGQWYYRIGQMDKQTMPPVKDMRHPANRIKNYVRYSNFHQARRNKRLNMIHLNWWCRDQNFRKYFEMRKKHDIRPSESGFYHEPIFEAATQKNREIAAMR